MSLRLPNFLNHGGLNALRSVMDAPLVAPFGGPSEIRAIEIPIVVALRNEGIDATIDEIEQLPDRTLSFRGHRVLVYIRDVASYGGETSLPRFHLSYCRTLEKMRQQHRFERYVVANRDDGHFQVNLVDERTTSKTVRLDVCQHCLEALSWKGFRGDLSREARKSHVSSFALTEFFDRFPRDLISVRPQHSSNSAPLNAYPTNWGEISASVKASRGFRCERCSLLLTDTDSRYLHVHHRNGLKSDSSSENLQLLCLGCHAIEPNHGHMKRLPEYAGFVGRFGYR